MRIPVSCQLALTKLIVVIGLAAVVPPALAQARAATPIEQSEQLIRQGNQLRSVGDDQNALPMFEKAVELNPTPRTWALLGLVEKALGRWSEADRHLTDALKAQQDPWIQKNVVVLEKTLADAKRQVARIEITGEPAGAEVLVNGRPVGKVPLAQPIRVNAGTVDVELRAPGYKSALRTVAVVGLQYQPVVIRLEPVAQASGDSSSGPLPPLVSPGSGADTAGRQAWRPWAVGGALASAALGVGIGVYGVSNHERKVAEFNKNCAVKEGGVIVNEMTGARDPKCNSLHATYTNAKTMAFIGFGAGAALGATALILYLTTPDGGSGAVASRALPVCTAGPGELGIGCTLRF